jgi:hypothetical protein
MKNTTINPSRFKTEKSYFRNNPKFGRATKLTLDGVVVLEGLGINSKTEMMQRYFAEQRMNNKKPNAGDTMTVWGVECTITKVYPFGTVDVISKDGNLARRVTGLNFL